LDDLLTIHVLLKMSLKLTKYCSAVISKQAELRYQNLFPPNSSSFNDIKKSQSVNALMAKMDQD
ncbi:MAG TPA: hypothetical protein DCL56_15245, partial [Lactobacillus sp.]|nr:hypothetical protein [Lactobacillus sp.]